MKSTSYSPEMYRWASSTASFDTATRMSMRDAIRVSWRLKTRYAADSPAEWNVATIGASFMRTAESDGPGTSGSCTWRTSNASSFSARIVRSAAGTSGASGATDPLTAVGRLLPRGVTNDSGGGPSHGPRTRTSWPCALIARARPRTCCWTPPGMVRL